MSLQKSIEEIELIRESALLVSKTLGLLAKEIKEGVTTLMLDKIAEEFIRDNNAIPGFLGLYDFPNTLCTSPNSQVVHGIPNDEPLKNGDIISIDCGVLKNDFYGDHAFTFVVGEVSDDVQKLLQISKEPISTKGPRLTAELSLAGRYMVLTPFSDKVSVSQKIAKNEEKNRSLKFFIYL